ncbi:hypothetical protein TNCT_515691 [Trichonephila clavata]|uniref:Uncharacterized protein n=1 Tax=Trichonephila clavata TaxID=2740835 RepID=A0A8X6J289_TRICU|nr:hypothetical protein TNCT_515691 [Trichonephila clavata]
MQMQRINMATNPQQSTEVYPVKCSRKKEKSKRKGAGGNHEGKDSLVELLLPVESINDKRRENPIALFVSC